MKWFFLLALLLPLFACSSDPQARKLDAIIERITTGNPNFASIPREEQLRYARAILKIEKINLSLTVNSVLIIRKSDTECIIDDRVLPGGSHEREFFKQLSYMTMGKDEANQLNELFSRLRR